MVGSEGESAAGMLVNCLSKLLTSTSLVYGKTKSKAWMQNNVVSYQNGFNR